MSSRIDIYTAIDAERAYQDGWHDRTLTDSSGQHSTTEFLVYIDDYTREALHICTRRGDPEAKIFALHSLRKIAALAVAATEQHGVLVRDPADNLKQRHSGG